MFFISSFDERLLYIVSVIKLLIAKLHFKSLL